MNASTQNPSSAPAPMSRNADDDTHLPLRSGCWVASGEGGGLQIARVRSCYRMGGEVLLDLYVYDMQGNNLGRTSPVMGGPRGFEPSCSLEGWQRIEEPEFPLQPQWVPVGDDTGRRTMGYGGVKAIPFGRYAPDKPKVTARASGKRTSNYDPILEAAARRMSAQELRDLARTIPAASRAPLKERAAALEDEADKIAPRS